MEIKEFTPDTQQSLTLPLKEVRIMPIGDLQYGAEGCDVDRFVRHITWGMEQECYFVGLGDYQDVMSPSNRRKWLSMNGEFYDSMKAAFDDKMAQVGKELEEILAPTRGRWLGLIKGHHYHQYGDGTTSVSRLADFLGCPNLGDCATVTLNLKEGNKRCPVILWLHHGAGSSTMAGGALNKLERVANRFFAHIYLAGHQHTKPAVPVPFIEASTDARGRPTFHAINRYLVATGGWLKGYEEGTKDPLGHPSGSYIEQGMLMPVTLGGPVIYIRPRFRGGRPAPDINVSI